MLKLERIDNTQKIAIRIQHKERFLNRIFLIALAVALALHLLPLTLFTVTPFRLNYIHQDLPPATVSAHTENNDTLVNTSAEEMDLSIKNLGLIALPETPLLIQERFSTLKPEIQLTKETFSSLDPFQQEYFATTPLSSIQLPTTYSPLTIDVSGPLATYSLILTDQLKKQLEPRVIEGNALQEKVVFAVQYEGTTESLFWYEPLELSKNKKINALAEKLIPLLKFQNAPHELFTSGEVTLYFTLNQKECKKLIETLN